MSHCYTRYRSEEISPLSRGHDALQLFYQPWVANCLIVRKQDPKTFVFSRSLVPINCPIAPINISLLEKANNLAPIVVIAPCSSFTHPVRSGVVVAGLSYKGLPLLHVLLELLVRPVCVSPKSILMPRINQLAWSAENYRMVTGSFKIACVLHTLNDNQQTRVHLEDEVSCLLGCQRPVSLFFP